MHKIAHITFPIQRLLKTFVFLCFSGVGGCTSANKLEHGAIPSQCRSSEDAGAGTGRSADHIMYRGKPVYLNGFNIAWFDFAKDFGRGLDEKSLRKALADVHSVGGNSLRWWVHIDGSQTPAWGKIDGQLRVIGPGGSLLNDFKRALDIAAEYNVYIVPSLWSFDMLRDNPVRTPPNHANALILADDQVRQSYIDNALMPMVQALNAHPQLIAWELFNEPENMTESWLHKEDVYFGGEAPTKHQIQRTHGLFAAAIHRSANAMGQTALVTTGSKSIGKYNSDVAGGTNWYRDDRLIAAADGDPLATLDFYEPHYYNNESCNGGWSPFHHNANHWGLDKPIVIGEFYVNEFHELLNDPVAKGDLCLRLRNNGYAGGWSWQWNEYAGAMKACSQKLKQPKHD